MVSGAERKEQNIKSRKAEKQKSTKKKRHAHIIDEPLPEMRARRRDGALCEDALEVRAVQRQHADCPCVSYPVIQCVSETVSS